MNFSPTLYHGESRIFPVTLVDRETGQFCNLSSGKWQVSTIEWQVKAAIEGADPPLIAKSIGLGITVTPGVVAEQIKVFVDPADTPSIAPGSYVNDLVAVFASGFRLYLIKPSGITVAGVVNQL